jgi:hypothetical protein
LERELATRVPKLGKNHYPLLDKVTNSHIGMVTPLATLKQGIIPSLTKLSWEKQLIREMKDDMEDMGLE